MELAPTAPPFIKDTALLPLTRGTTNAVAVVVTDTVIIVAIADSVGCVVGVARDDEVGSVEDDGRGVKAAEKDVVPVEVAVDVAVFDTGRHPGVFQEIHLQKAPVKDVEQNSVGKQTISFR